VTFTLDSGRNGDIADSKPTHSSYPGGLVKLAT
jgi:hypothetical protein